MKSELEAAKGGTLVIYLSICKQFNFFAVYQKTVVF
jgi:hypothetical protein